MSLNIEENKYLVGISVLDLLGTKGVWKTNPSAYLSNVTYLFEKYNDLVNSLYSSILEPIRVKFDNGDILLEFKTFSDTIFIIVGISSKLIEESNVGTKRKRISASCGIILTIIGFLLLGFLNASFQKHLFFRGSLSLGTIYIKDDIIIGPAIDEAAEDYEESNWIGISLTPSASLMLNQLLNKNNILSEVLGDLYIQYDLLKKKGIEKNCFVLDWTKFYLEGIQPNNINILKNYLNFDSDHYIDNNVYSKYKNTVDFYNMMDSHKKFEIKTYFIKEKFIKLVEEQIKLLIM